VFTVKNNALSACANFLAVFNNYNDTLTFQDLSTLDSVNEKSVVFTKESMLGPRNDSFTCLSFLSFSSHLLLGTDLGMLVKIVNPLLKKKQTEKHRFLDLCTSESTNEEVFLLSKGSSHREEQVLAVTKTSKTTYHFYIVNSSKMILKSAFSSASLGIEEEITAACFGNMSPDEHLVLIGGSSCKIYVVSVKTTINPNSDRPIAKVLQIFPNHEHPITILSLDHNERRFLSGSQGRTKRLWKLEVSRVRV